jgi:hypothetical protein
VEGQEGRGRKRKDLGDEGQGGREKGRGERGREGGREGGQGKGIRARIICPSCHRPFLPPSLRPALDSAFQAHASLAGYRGCPRCFTYISSEGGCLKMTCICGCQFCMACGQRRGKAGARAGARAGGREDCGCESRHHVWPDRALTPWKSVSWEWEALERRAREEAKEGGREGGRTGGWDARWSSLPLLLGEEGNGPSRRPSLPLSLPPSPPSTLLSLRFAGLRHARRVSLPVEISTTLSPVRTV